MCIDEFDSKLKINKSYHRNKFQFNMGWHGSVCLGDGVHKIGSAIKKLIGPNDAIPLNLIKLFWEKINCPRVRAY